MPSTVNIPGNVDSLPVSNNLVKFIESWESFSSTGYNGLDYWNTTIGYGHVELPGQDYTSITQPQAEQLLISDLKIYSASVENEFVGYNLTQNQLDALTDLCFGLGTNIWPSISLTHDVKSHASDDVIKSDYEALDNVGGSPSEGLLRRRDAEYIMFTQDVYELNT
jgi:lysozyme